MNKGLIIDKKEKYIIVMDDKAHYKRLNNKVHADIGQKYILQIVIFTKMCSLETLL